MRPELGHWSQKRSLDTGERWAQSAFYRRAEVEMGNAELSDHQLLAEVMAAFREKDIERAKPFFAEFSKRRLAKSKAKVANDTA